MGIEVMAESTSPLPLSLRLVIKLLDSKASQTCSCSFLPSCKLHPADVQIREKAGGKISSMIASG